MSAGGDPGVFEAALDSTRKRAEAFQCSLRLQHLQDFLEDGKNLLWFHRVEQIPNGVVTWDLVNPKQALGITATFAALHHPVVHQMTVG